MHTPLETKFFIFWKIIFDCFDEKIRKRLMGYVILIDGDQSFQVEPKTGLVLGGIFQIMDDFNVMIVTVERVDEVEVAID